MDLHLFLADAAPAAQQGNIYQTVLLIVVAVLFFYFMLIRPEQKRRKQMEEMRKSLKKGDKVTAMGIMGEVWRISKDEIVIITAGETKIAFMPEAITQVQTPPAQPVETPPSES